MVVVSGKVRSRFLGPCGGGWGAVYKMGLGLIGLHLGYMLTAASLQLFFGKLYTFLSIKWVFLSAVWIFELGSLICGLAPNSLALIMGRVVAGIGCAGLMTGGLLILAHSVPLAKRPVYT